MIKVTKNNGNELVMIACTDDRTGELRLINMSKRTILTKPFKDKLEVRDYFTGLLKDGKIKSLFIKGEYIKSEKYAERANILEDIYNELNNI